MPLKPKYQKMKDKLVKQYGTKKGESAFWAIINKQGIKDEVEMKAYVFYSSEFKALDDNLIEGHISTGDRDLLNDIVTPNCMVDMLNQLQDRSIKLDIEHESFKGGNSLEKEINKTIIPIGKIDEAVLDKKGIKVKAVLNIHHSRIDEVKGSIKDGFLDAFSIAYVPIKYAYKTIDKVKTRMLEKVNLLNIAFTGNPVNTKASFTNIVLKSLEDGFEFTDDINEVEINKLLGGLNMTEKEEEVVKTEETTKEESKETPKEEATKKETVEAKALLDRIETQAKEITELKAVIEKKDEEKTEDKKTEKEPEKIDKEPEKEPVAEDNVEVKALTEKVDAINNSIEELKSLFKKEDGDNNEKILEQLKSIEEKQKEFDSVLSAPQFKAKVEQMKEKLDEKIEEVKSLGPLDAIQ